MFLEKRQVLFTGVGVERGFGYVPSIDLNTRELRMRWYEYYDEAGGFASVMTFDDYVNPEPKPGVLFHLAEQVLDPTALESPSRVAMALLARERPRFVEGAGPEDGTSPTTSSCRRWVGQLDESYVAVQGPPGSGKTYSGSHIIYALIKAGKRVGITAMSHAISTSLFSRDPSSLRRQGGAE